MTNLYLAYDMPRYMRGKRRFDEARTLGEMFAASAEMKQSHFKTLAEAKAFADEQGRVIARDGGGG